MIHPPARRGLRGAARDGAERWPPRGSRAPRMSQLHRVDAVVAGAGVVGLAVARALSVRHGVEVFVLESQGSFGTGTSSRSSEVIHAGIYYPEGSWKARLCVAGKAQLYDYCASRGIGCRNVGKVIVASAAQAPRLAGIQAAAAANGVGDLRALSAADVHHLEPEVRAGAGLLSPSTGIVDSHGLMASLAVDVEESGSTILSNSELVPLEPGDAAALRAAAKGAAGDARHVCRLADGTLVGARLFVNCCGLDAPYVAKHCVASVAARRPAAPVPAPHYAKGSYFALSGVPPPFQHLVYPLPEPGGLGTHATLDLSNRVRFGPNVEWLRVADGADRPAREALPADAFDVAEADADGFYEAVRRYYPGLPDGALRPDYAGVRPKLGGPRDGFRDFVLDVDAAAGVAHLLGIESPGLTSSLALADAVADRLAA